MSESAPEPGPIRRLIGLVLIVIGTFWMTESGL